MYHLLLGLAFVIATPALAAPPQLNVSGFAHCLAAEDNAFSIKQLDDTYDFGRGDLLLAYLAVYPGKRLAGIAGRLQALAHDRWATAWEPREAKLADVLAHLDERTKLTPAMVFREALKLCDRHDIFCGALIAHNVLRTLGRHSAAISHSKDRNPAWFKERQEFWLKYIPQLERTMVALRSTPGGERFGEWYHFFGLLVYGIRELSVHGNFTRVSLAAFLNRVANPILLGGPEAPAKVQLDKDSIRVAALYLRHEDQPAPAAGCNAGAAYAAEIRTEMP